MKLRLSGDSKDYKPPFKFTGKIKKVEIYLGEAGMSEDEKALNAKIKAGKDY